MRPSAAVSPGRLCIRWREYAVIVEAELRGGVIYGDRANGEYVYMPASEVGAVPPVCVYETEAGREDVDMGEALRLIRVRSLKPTRHPRLGESSL